MLALLLVILAYLFQLIADQPSVSVHVQVFEHGVHQRPLLLHVSLPVLLPKVLQFGLQVEQRALQPVVLRHGAGVTYQNRERGDRKEPVNLDYLARTGKSVTFAPCDGIQAPASTQAGFPCPDSP